MSELPSSNGHHPPVDDHEPKNVYADAMRGSRPREIVDFELTTDPYANVVPTMSRARVSAAEVADEKRERNPWMIGLSVLLIVLLVLPPLVVVFGRLGL